MAYPYSTQTAGRVDSTPTLTQHKDDHNAAIAALNDLLTELGAGPKGAAADLTARLAALDALVALKAALASPALTGTPTAPTAAANTNTTQIASTAYVQTEITDEVTRADGAYASVRSGLAPSDPVPAPAPVSMIATMQSGHGFTADGSGT